MFDKPGYLILEQAHGSKIRVLTNQSYVILEMRVSTVLNGGLLFKHLLNKSGILMASLMLFHYDFVR